MKLVDKGMGDLFGTEPHRLHRRNSKKTSKAAAYSVNSKGLEYMVLKAINEYGLDGCIADDLLEQFPRKPYSSITARFSALEEKGLITSGPDTRPSRADHQQDVRRSTMLGRMALTENQS